MKLSEQQIQLVEGQTGARVIAPDHPSLEELESNFGEHTFFLDQDGLHVWERPSDAETECTKLVSIRLATWSDEKENSLIPHEPAPMQVIQETN